MTSAQYEVVKQFLGLPYVTPERLARSFKKHGADIKLRDVRIVATTLNYEGYLNYDPLDVFDDDQRDMLRRTMGL